MEDGSEDGTEGLQLLMGDAVGPALETRFVRVFCSRITSTDQPGEPTAAPAGTQKE